MEKIVTTNSNEATALLFGAFDANIRLVENAFSVKISNRNTKSQDGDALVVSGEEESVLLAVRALDYLKRMVGNGPRPATPCRSRDRHA